MTRCNSISVRCDSGRCAAAFDMSAPDSESASIGCDALGCQINATHLFATSRDLVGIKVALPNQLGFVTVLCGFSESKRKDIKSGWSNPKQNSTNLIIIVLSRHVENRYEGFAASHVWIKRDLRTGFNRIVLQDGPGCRQRAQAEDTERNHSKHIIHPIDLSWLFWHKVTSPYNWFDSYDVQLRLRPMGGPTTFCFL